MSTANSKLELFALKSFVSVLPEPEKETALKIVGGHDPWDDLPEGYLPNIFNPDDAWFFDDWFDWMGEQGYDDPWLLVDDQGYNIWAGHDGCENGAPPPFPAIGYCMDREDWEEVKEAMGYQ